MLELEPKGISMDVDTRWIGNASCVLEVSSIVGVSFPVQKKFDFTLKVVGGDVSSIPGVTEKLNEMIHNAVLESLSWPMRICIQIISTPADSNTTRLNRHMFPRRNAAIFAATGSEGKPPVGILDVKLVQGRDLWDTGKPPDPFALLYIHATPGQIRRSTTIVRNMCWATANFTCRDLTTGGSQSDGLKFLRMRVVLEIWMKPSIGDRFLLKGEY